MAARAAKGSPISFIPSFAQDDYPPVTHRLFVTNEGSKWEKSRIENFDQSMLEGTIYYCILICNLYLHPRITASWINMLEATTPEVSMRERGL